MLLCKSDAVAADLPSRPRARAQPGMSEIVNLTPHAINVHVANNDDRPATTPRVVTFPPSGTETRLRSNPQVQVATLPNGVPIFTAPSFREDALADFPFKDDAPQNHRDVLLSMLVVPHIPEWFTGAVYFPDTGPGSAIRENGKIVGVARLCIRTTTPMTPTTRAANGHGSQHKE